MISQELHALVRLQSVVCHALLVDRLPAGRSRVSFTRYYFGETLLTCLSVLICASLDPFLLDGIVFDALIGSAAVASCLFSSLLLSL